MAARSSLLTQDEKSSFAARRNVGTCAEKPGRCSLEDDEVRKLDPGLADLGLVYRLLLLRRRKRALETCRWKVCGRVVHRLLVGCVFEDLKCVRVL